MREDCKLEPLNLESWDRLIQKTLLLNRNSSIRIQNYDKIVEELKNKAKKKELSAENIKDKSYSLVLLNLWSTNKEFVKEVPFSRDLFQIVLEFNDNYVSSLMIYSLIDIYFFQYDLLGKQGDFLTKFIKKSIDERFQKNKDTTLVNKHKYRSFLFDSSFNVHEKIVINAIAHRNSLSKELMTYDLYQCDFGRFYEKMRLAYYINFIKTQDLFSCDRILDEILKEEIYKKDYEQGKSVGHKLIHILLERLENHIFEIKKYQFITNFIIQIAGDPRVEQSNIRYQNWWLVLGETDIAKMKKFLSGYDLELFLEIYGEFAKTESSYNEQNMFFERQKFLRGMLMQNLIHETKLFIGKSMLAYLKQNYKTEEMPRYYVIKDDPSRAVIFMRYKEQLFTEGSFNCFFRGYDYILEASPWYQNKKEYTYKELNKELAEKYMPDSVFEKVHNGDWQSSIIWYFNRKTKERLNNGMFYDGYTRW